MRFLIPIFLVIAGCNPADSAELEPNEKIMTVDERLEKLAGGWDKLIAKSEPVFFALPEVHSMFEDVGLENGCTAYGTISEKVREKHYPAFSKKLILAWKEFATDEEILEEKWPVESPNSRLFQYKLRVNKRINAIAADEVQFASDDLIERFLKWYNASELKGSKAGLEPKDKQLFPVAQTFFPIKNGAALSFACTDYLQAKRVSK